jgi:hypothetical protein
MCCGLLAAKVRPLLAGGVRTPTIHSESEILMRHRFGKGVVGLVAGLAALCLLALPAPAADVTATIGFISSTTGTVPGNITVYNADEEAVTSIPLPGAGLTCSTGTTNLTVSVTGASNTTTSGTGNISILFNNYCGSFTTGAGTALTRWCAFMTGHFRGTWNHISGTTTTTSTHTFASNISSTTLPYPPLTVVLRKNSTTGTHNCHTLHTGSCTITTSNFPISGIINSPNMHLNVSDTIIFSGSSNVGDGTVTGTAADCGIFIGANNGSGSITGHVHIVSNP